MKKKLFRASLKFLALLLSLNSFAQADPVFTALNPVTDEVTITNIGDMEIDIANYWLCTDGRLYDRIGTFPTASVSTLLGEGESITVTWNDLGVINGNNNATIMLFANSNFGSSSSNDVIDHVRWGTSDFRVAQGVAAGRWSSIDATITCPGPFSTGGIRGGSPIGWGEADGGTIAINVDQTNTLNTTGTTRIDGEFEVSICVDSRPDPIAVSHITQATNRSYLYVITDDSPEETILNIVASNEISLDGAGVGTCKIWGWSYSGQGGRDAAFATFGGRPLQEMRDVNCSSVSEQAITVVREAADAGIISIDTAATDNANGTTTINSATSATIIVGDDIANPIVVNHINDSPNLSYRYVITDAATGVILNIVNTNSIDLNGVEAGTCEIWGWSYRGLDQSLFIRQPLQALRDASCSDISAESIEVVRVAPTEFTATLSGLQENPAVLTQASGSITAVLTGNELVVSGSFEGLSGALHLPAAGGDHIHRAIAGRNGGVELQLTAVLNADSTAGTYAAADNTFVLTAEQSSIKC